MVSKFLGSKLEISRGHGSRPPQNQCPLPVSTEKSWCFMQDVRTFTAVFLARKPYENQVFLVRHRPFLFYF